MPLYTISGHRHERGYALLLIFLMAAVVALSMFAVLPRVAFEAQRDQEQLLVDRGEQYKRAIQLYYRKMKKYPVKLEDLENTNNMRFLRDRYNDPLTGKNEWRLIHVGPGGVFTDSLTQKNNNKTQQTASGPNNFVGELQGLGDVTGPADSDGVNVGLRRRASDPGGSDPSNDPNAPLPLPDPNAPAGVPGINVPVPSQTNTAYSNLTANSGLGQNNAASAASSGNGADMIRNLLTSPRPGGAPPGVFGASNQPGSTDGSQSSGSPSSGSQSFGFNSSNATNVLGGSAGGSFGNQIPGSSTPGQSIGSSAGTFATGSFAGVASTVKRPGIKIYAEHKKYNEWEFIYDYGKDPAFGGGGVLPVPNNLNNPNGTNSNNSANPNNSTNPNNPTNPSNFNSPTSPGSLGSSPGTGTTGSTTNPAAN